ncbi:alpha-amylase family glycosyl hydrolase [Haliscomenobacter hydrossis]|uniref:Amylosucrase n=1 Tax=Haliscomenobacter hydrossis (strain ATCC 27775 / DSM 1100 / LMG 10767 / O) TaxID=760192 RepID=F4KUY4_HALH1|nr:alpha-amylase family glycosyl hydrolase [Haliscomenobacter hydrossis]AEE48160.1 Amylosucrase [Haliscomenobacter hydrossis DSM 1100]
MKQAKTIERRSRLFMDDFLHSYRVLYPDAGPERIQRLMDILSQVDQKRSPSLKNLDADREWKADWFQQPDQVGMMLYVDLFASNLQGVIEHIDYFQELGITYLHLMPLLKPRNGPNDGGYAVADYRAVNERLGTMEQLRDLAALLHEKGMLLVIDYVMNHTAREHQWAQAALSGDKHFQDFYLLFDDRALPDAYERTLPEVFPDFAPGNFTWQPEIQKWAWTTFYDFQWDLNYRNPDVFEAMLEEMLFLANVGVDILRLDAVPFLWKNLGTNCQNQQEAIHILAAYRALVRMVAPGLLFKSEAIVAPEDIIRYLGSGGLEGKVCEIGYNATLMNHLWQALAAENTHLLRTTLSRLPAIPKEATWINYIRCHDDIGWGISDENAAAVGQSGRGTRNYCSDFYSGVLPHSYAEGYIFQRDRQTGEARTSGTAAALTGLQKALVEADPQKIDLAIKRLEVLNGVIFFMRGIPLIFSGDEIGQLNDYAYLLDPLKAGDNRWVHRPPMNWAKAARIHEAGTPEARIFSLHQRYIAVRRQSPALHSRSVDRIILPDSDALFVCERNYQGHKMLLVANLSRTPQRMSISLLPPEWQNGVYVDALRQQSMSFINDHLSIGPYGVYWLKPALSLESTSTTSVELSMYVPAEFGEELYVVGSLPILGNWDWQKGLSADSKDYPHWKLRFEVVKGQAFSWKWVRVRNGKVVMWAEEDMEEMPL